MQQLKIERLNKTYANGIQALRDVSLEIPRGMFGLLGPNGAGKSTLMRTLATLQEPDSGDIRFQGIDVLNEKQQVKTLLGYLPQQFGFYGRDRAQDLLDHFARLKGLTQSKARQLRVEELLHRVNLWGHRGQRLGTYSGGMKQRFGIAQALLGDPKLIIVDEPTAGLDPGERRRFHNLLSEIGEDVVVILSTHIVDDVSDLCRNMAIINKGQVIMTGNPSDAIASLQGCIWEKKIEKSTWDEYEARYAIVSSRMFGGATYLRIHTAQHPQSGFVSVAPTLEDVYFHQLKQTAISG